MCLYEPRGKVHTQQEMVGVENTYWVFLYLCGCQPLCKYGHGLCSNFLMVLQPIPLIPVYSPCKPQVPQPLSVLIHICSELDLMLPVTLLSVPNLKMGTCASGRTRKESLFFKINSWKYSCFRIWDRGRSYLILVCPFLLQDWRIPDQSYSDLKNLVFEALR